MTKPRVVYAVGEIMAKHTIFIAADHAGFGLKEELKRRLAKLAPNAETKDLTPVFTDEDDYPEIATALAKKVAKTKDASGVLACGSGVGVTIAANRVPKIRAFAAYDEETVELAREHNDVNVIAFSGWNQDADQAAKLLKTFLETKASTAERHKRRVKQLG